MQYQAWTEDRVLQLVRLWKEGFSGSEIAQVLKGTTRNAIIGKAYRLGLSRPRMAHKQALKGTTRNAIIGKAYRLELSRPRMVRKVAASSEHEKRAPARILAPSLEIPFQDLQPGQCKAVTGAQRFAHTFCGNPTLLGSQYCQEHHQLYHQPADKTKKKRYAAERPSPWLDRHGQVRVAGGVL